MFESKFGKFLICVIKLQNYYEAREKNPTLFNLPGPTKNKFFLETGSVFMLPNRDQYGREIYVFRIGKVIYIFLISVL